MISIFIEEFQGNLAKRAPSRAFSDNCVTTIVQGILAARILPGNSATHINFDVLIFLDIYIQICDCASWRPSTFPQLAS